MSRRVRPRMENIGNDIADSPGSVSEVQNVNLLSLHDDTMIDLFTRLNDREKASLASTCRTWRKIGASPCLWKSLDLHAVKLDLRKAASLSGRCEDLEKVRFRGCQSANSVIFLKAKKLKEIRGDFCNRIVDATLCVIAARHQALESIELGPEACEKITSEAIKVVAYCCPKLKTLRISGVKDVTAEAIESLAQHCTHLTEVGLIDCLKVNAEAVGKLESVRYLSVAGTVEIDWSAAAEIWVTLPVLTGLDVSRTNIDLAAASPLILSSNSLMAFCAVHCPLLRQDDAFKDSGKVVLRVDGVYSSHKPIDLFLKHVIRTNKDDVMDWVEWVVSHSYLRIAHSTSKVLDDFWVKGGGALALHILMHSSLEDVKERAVTAIANFIVVDGGEVRVDRDRAEEFVKDGGMLLLLELAMSGRESLQAEAAKAIANLIVNAKAAEFVSKAGGISVLVDLAKSMSRLVAEEAAGGLWNLSIREEYKSKIAEAGGAEALIELMSRWRTDCDEVTEHAAGALANLASDEKCSVLIAEAGGVDVLVKLARDSKCAGAQQQAARALANLAAISENNDNYGVVGEESGALEVLVQLLQSPYAGVKQEASGALWNLAFDDKNRETIAALGGVTALVEIVKSPQSVAFPGLHERAAGALWGLSVSEVISTAVVNEGGIPPLVALARSFQEDAHETAAGALWNLAHNPSNAMQIVEEGGSHTLGFICLTSGSKTARFLAALALAYMFDGRMVWDTSERTFHSAYVNISKEAGLKHMKGFIKTFVKAQFIEAAALSYSPTELARVLEKAKIVEASHLRCGSSEIERFVKMLRNPSPILRSCAAFALLQLTIPGARHAMHHASLIQNTGKARILRSVAAARTMPLEGRVFAKILLRNLEHHRQAESSEG